MAEKAQRSQILKIALSAALHDGQDMISIPQCFSRKPPQTPLSEKPQPVGSARAAQLPMGSASVDSADRADAPVPLQNLFTKVAGIGTKAPFVYTPIRTESETPRRNLKAAPAAQRPAAIPFG